MIPLLTADEVRRAEQAAVRAGRSESELMVAAGTGVADAIHEVFGGRTASVVILAGPGKNGGDGIVVADRLSAQGWNVSIWPHHRHGVDGAPVTDDFAKRVTWVGPGSDLDAALNDASVVVDAIFGVSGRPELPAEVESVFDTVRRIRRRRRYSVWAVDVPSGISVDTGEIAEGALAAGVTAMIGLPKVGAYRLPAASFTGRIAMINIGLEAPADLDSDTPRLLATDDVGSEAIERRAGAHKRSVGTVLVVGGAPNYYGGPRLAAEAALRSGAGMVSVAAPSYVISTIASAVPELTYMPLPSGEHGTAGDRMASIVRKKLSSTNALVIGPGLGTDAPVPEFLRRFFGINSSGRRGIGFGQAAEDHEDEAFTGKAVLDADALNWLATESGWSGKLEGAELVLTPHPGELARMLDVEREKIQENPWEYARQSAGTFGQIVVLKFAHTVIATPDGRLFVAPHAPPSLASAGTGDVLSGIIGSFMAQGMSAEDAACSGVIVGLIATDLAERQTGETGLVASDIIRQLPTALVEVTGTQRMGRLS